MTRHDSGHNWLICRAITDQRNTSVSDTESAFGADLAVRRLANPVTLCDGHGAFFMAASGQNPMAAYSRVHPSDSARFP